MALFGSLAATGLVDGLHAAVLISVGLALAAVVLSLGIQPEPAA